MGVVRDFLRAAQDATVGPIYSSAASLCALIRFLGSSFGCGPRPQGQSRNNHGLCFRTGGRTRNGSSRCLCGELKRGRLLAPLELPCAGCDEADGCGRYCLVCVVIWEHRVGQGGGGRCGNVAY
jgi:hypothetical protein